MENHNKESNGGGLWMSVPAFGEWDLKKDGAMPDYSMDFSKIREMRKNKGEFSRASIGNEEDLIQQHLHQRRGSGDDSEADLGHRRHHSLKTKKKIMNYFHCCIIGA